MIWAPFGMTCKELDYHESIPQDAGPQEWPIDYTVCTGARIIQHALSYLIKEMGKGHGTPIETIRILWEARTQSWKETLEIMDPENHPDSYDEMEVN
jgi:hypothetical protein